MVNYKVIGNNFVSEINKLLEDNHMKAAFVTGGGFAYDSIKYKDGKCIGDYDFMIVYDDMKDVERIIEMIRQTEFNFDDKYLDLDIKLLCDKQIDIIRLSGNYNGIKSTVNLVPFDLINKISSFEDNYIIKKIAHNRNTSLFFAYGSNKSRIMVNFISPSFVTEDLEDHYIHLDFSFIKKEENVYLGILADAILKGFQLNYDTINFNLVRSKFIKKIHQYFEENSIPSSNYINIFANNNYFSSEVIQKLTSEFEFLGHIVGEDKTIKKYKPIIFTTDFDRQAYTISPFNFINNKDYKMPFIDYINLMQETEYDRQYLIDALGKFLGYLSFSQLGLSNYSNSSIISDIDVYGTNDLYLDDFNKYSFESIVESLINELVQNKINFNYVFLKEYLEICLQFLVFKYGYNFEELCLRYNIKDIINSNNPISSKINIQNILRCNNFYELATYHNYISSVMPNYTELEANLLESLFIDKTKKVLDIMCGYGRIANKLKQKGYLNIGGIDQSTYDMLAVDKDFHFIQGDVYNYNFNDRYDYVYNLYNSYTSPIELYKLLETIGQILNPNGIYVYDAFNRSWRENIEPQSYKVLYQDQDYRLIIKRFYDNVTGMEDTVYVLYYHDNIIKEYRYSQRFFYEKEITDMIDSGWDFDILTSSGQSRNSNQKYIMKLRKK